MWLWWTQCKTLKTLIWQLDEWTCSMYSPCWLVVNVSTWIRKGTPFSPPCFLGVNSVLMQLTWDDGHKGVGQRNRAGHAAATTKQRQRPPSRRLAADPLYLDESRSVLGGIPEELNGVELQSV